MSDIINVTIIGHSSTGLNSLENVIQEDTGIDLTRKLLVDGVVDPFENLAISSDVIVLDLADNWREVMDSVNSRSRRNRTPMILVGPEGNTELMRLAVRAGARDFFTRPVSSVDLLRSIHQLANEKDNNDSDSTSANLVVCVSAKGGAGASSIVANMGHVLASRKDKSRTLLIDLDLQYGNLPVYFDEPSTTRLTQAVIANERVDETLLDACVIQTDAGVDLLASYSDQVFSSWETQQNTTSNLLNLVCDRYDHVLIDIPRQIDPITFQAIEMASCICVVMQQTLSDLRYTRQILGLLRDQGLPNDRLRVIVNRHDKKNVLRAVDISDAFDGVLVSTLPNDSKRMSYSTDNAKALIKQYRKAPLTKGIVTLVDSLFPIEVQKSGGLFGRR